MLKKQHRLNKNQQFNLIFKRGRSGYGLALGLKIIANSLPYSRFAFLISKKVSKRAVERNLIKRRLCEAVRLDWLDLAGYDVVVIVLPPALGKNLAEIRESLGKAFAKLKIVK